MAVYVLTGKMGAGKTLCAVGKIQDVLNGDRPVATNLDIYLHKLIHPKAKRCQLIRLPDKPTVYDLESLPPGNTSYDENKNGLIVLDECGTWFNARGYQDKDRHRFINWLVHARKKGWDIIFIVQHINMIDKQARDGVCEHLVSCMRSDRLPIPFVGTLLKLFGIRQFLPQIHLAIVRYGANSLAPVVDRWVYQGKALYQAYDTKQAFVDFEGDEADRPRAYCELPPHHYFSWYKKRAVRDGKFIMRLTKIYFKRFNKPVLAGLSAVLGVCFSMGMAGADKAVVTNDTVKVVEDAPRTEAVVESEKAVKPETLQERFASYRISAYMGHSSGKHYYQIGNGETRYTSDSLRAQGYHVVAKGACQLLIKNREDETDFAVVHSLNCVSRDQQVASIPKGFARDWGDRRQSYVAYGYQSRNYERRYVDHVNESGKQTP